MNMVDLIRSETAALPEGKVAVHEAGGDLTYVRLFEKVDLVSTLLKEQGVAALDRVGLAWPDSADYIVVSLALLSIGAVLVPVPVGVAEDVVDDVLEKTAASFLLTAGITGEPVERGGFTLSGYQPAGALPEEFNEMNPAFIRFSSGTTSESKGVLLSHQDVAERTALADQALQITSGDTVIWLLSMSFHFVVTILLFLRRGATINLCSDTFPYSFLSAVEQGGATFMYGTPFHYRTLVEHADIERAALSDIRMAVSTAMKLPAGTASAFRDKFGFALNEAYGVIEVGLPFVGREGREGSVGKPLPGIEIELRNPDETGVGEVWLHGPGMYSAYLHPWRRRAGGEWFDTGDVGRMEEGRLYLEGRTKTLINFAGMKVFPNEVEAVLERYDGVVEAYVYAEPHERYGQLPCAEVMVDGPVSKPQLQRFCYEHLESYKVPKKIEFVSELERTASGKLKRTNPACF